MFLNFFFRPNRFERRVMTQLEDIQAKLATLQAEIADANSKAAIANEKTDALITLTGSIKDQLAALAASGGLSPSDLSDVLGKIDDAVTSVHAIGTAIGTESDKVDAAIAADTPAPDAPPESGEPAGETPAT